MAGREPYRPLPDMLGQLGLDVQEVTEFWQPKGCEACRQTGYFGRVSINEVLVMSDVIRQKILQRVDASELQRSARDNGMRLMFEDGIDKAKSGITTVEEVMRVTREAD